MKQYIRIFLVVAVLLTSAFVIPVAQADQPHMQAALAALRSARHQLEIAADDKAGHRLAAIGIVDNAIAQVQAGIDAGK